jgi:hypothetical protein
MLRTTAVTLAISLAAALPAAAAAPAPAASAADGTPLQKGDTVTFDLTALPRRLEGGGQAICVGTIITAVGPTASRCERTFEFELAGEGARLTYVFRAASGGRETRVELPVVRSTRPVTFVAPSDGSFLPPAPITFPAEATDRAARKAAGEQCRRCNGQGFTLDSFKVTRQPGPMTFPVQFQIKRTMLPPEK